MERKGFKEKYWSTVRRRTLWGCDSVACFGTVFLTWQKKPELAVVMIAGFLASQIGYHIVEREIDHLDSRMAEAFSELKDLLKSARVTSLEARTEYVYHHLDRLSEENNFS